MTMMDDLTAFLRARLDEEEARIRDDIESWLGPGGYVLVFDSKGYDVDGCDIEPFIDPTSLRADIESKRQILDMWARWRSSYTGDDPEAWLRVQDTLKLFARRYAGHDDYREEWKP